MALCTDGVGTKLIVAEQAGRFDTVGIDCVAMNVNDLVCVGAEPLALVDYLAVEEADAGDSAAVAAGLKARRRARAGIEIPGGELAQLPEMIRGHPSPDGLDLVGSAIGVVALDRVLDGEADRARRRADRPALERPPLQRLHPRPPGAAGGRRAMALDDAPAELGRTARRGAARADGIYVRAALDAARLRDPRCTASRTSPETGC